MLRFAYSGRVVPSSSRWLGVDYGVPSLVVRCLSTGRSSLGQWRGVVSASVFRPTAPAWHGMAFGPIAVKLNLEGGATPFLFMSASFGLFAKKVSDERWHGAP